LSVFYLSKSFIFRLNGIWLKSTLSPAAFITSINQPTERIRNISKSWISVCQGRVPWPKWHQEIIHKYEQNYD